MSRALLRVRLVVASLAMLALVAAPLSLPSVALAAPPGQAFQPFWVQSFLKTELWSGPDSKAESFGYVEAGSYFKVLQPQQGSRYYVENPLSEGTAWIGAAAVSASGEPPESYFVRPAPAAVATAVPASRGSVDLPGRVVGGANVRSRPEMAGDTLIRQAGHNAPVRVVEEVTGSDGEAWYRIGDREFIHHSLVRLPRPFRAGNGKVIDADLNEPVLVTAYQDGRPVYSAMAIKGIATWETPTGSFTIGRRVANETMDSATIGIPRGAPGGYYLKDVLYTQYFTSYGASIHYNWWSSSFGYTGSHGCLGMNLPDAEWFWNWAGVGTPLIVRY